MIPATAAAVACFAVAFWWYLSKLHAALPGGDSGELIAAAAALVPAHPPGYPLFVASYHHLSPLMVTVVEFVQGENGGIPGSSAALASSGVVLQRYHAVSALFVSLGLGALAFGCARLAAGTIGSRTSEIQMGLTALGVSLIAVLGVHPTVVEYATTSEVFALHFFLICVLLVVMHHTVEAAGKNARQRFLLWLFVGAFTSGLAMANQQTALFLILPIAAFTAFDAWRRGWLQLSCVVGLLAIALGLSPYGLLLLWQWRTDSSREWGGWELPSSDLSGLWAHVLRRNYGTFRLHSGDHLEGKPPRFEELLHAVLAWAVKEIPTAVVGMTAVGTMVCLAASLVSSKGSSRQAAVVGVRVAAATAFQLVAFHSLANIPVGLAVYRHVYERFWLQLLTIIVVVPCCAASVVIGWLPRGAQRAASVAIVVAIAVLVAQPVSGTLVDTTSSPSDSEADAFSVAKPLEEVQLSFGLSLLEGAPKNAIVVTVGDVFITSVLAAQQVLGVRRDVLHVDRELFFYAWYKRALRRRFGVRSGVVWPKELINQETLATDGMFPNAALLARDNLLGVETPEEHRRPKTARRRPMMVLENAEGGKAVEDGPKLKEHFGVIGKGWLYDVVPRGSEAAQEGCDSLQEAISAFVASGAKKGKKEQKRWAEEQAKAFVGAALAPPALAWFQNTSAPLLTKLRTSSSFTQETLAELNPWAMTVMTQYALAFRTQVLSAASGLQACLASEESRTRFKTAKAQSAAAELYLRGIEEVLFAIATSEILPPIPKDIQLPLAVAKRVKAATGQHGAKKSVPMMTPATYKSLVLPIINLCVQVLKQ